MTKKVSSADIDNLYQKRKESLKVPDIQLEAQTQQIITIKKSIRSKIAILSISLAASFSIFAIISHLAVKKNPIMPASTQPSVTMVEIEIYNEINLNTNVAVAKKNSVDKLATADLASTMPSQEAILPHDEFTKSSPDKSKINLPELTKLIEKRTLLYKEMPKYSPALIKEKVEGVIRLSYTINLQGKIKNIQFVSGLNNRILKKSSIDALSKWYYQASDMTAQQQAVQRHVVEFNFNIN